MINKSNIYVQVMFCRMLMDRLSDSITSSKICCGALEKYTVKQNDITRLRRELLTLSEMLKP